MFQKAWNQSRRKYHPLCFFGAWPGAHHSKRLCNSSAALCVPSSRLLAFKGCCVWHCVSRVSLCELNEEAFLPTACLLLFFSIFYTKMSHNSPSPRTSNSRYLSSGGPATAPPPSHITPQRCLLQKHFNPQKIFEFRKKEFQKLKKCAKVIEDVNCAVMS